MNPKMLELKERIKLNAEYAKRADHSTYDLNYIHKYTQDAEHLKPFTEVVYYDEKEKRWKYGPKYIANRRIFHVAYSLIKGRTYEQIENKVREGNELTPQNWKDINQIKDSVNE